MLDDRRRPAQYASRRDEILRGWMAQEVYPYAPPLRERLDGAGLGRSGVRCAEDLRRLPAVSLTEVGSAAHLVLEPVASAIRDHGPLGLRWRLAFATASGRRAALAESVIDPFFRPVVWTAEGPRWIAWSAADLDRLTELGRRSLGIAGVAAEDRVALVDSTGSAAEWQLQLGCRDAGIAFHRRNPRAGATVGAPTVLAGSAETVCELLSRGSLRSGSAWLAIVLDQEVSSAQRKAITDLGVKAVRWWAPPGVRAAWAECDGPAVGFHTWPMTEVLHVEADTGAGTDDDTGAEGTGADARGELVWSAVGWRGTVLLRVRTGRAVDLETAQCASCGRTTPRVRPHAGQPAPSRDADAVDRTRPIAETAPSER